MDVACLVHGAALVLCFHGPSVTHADGRCQEAQMQMLEAQDYAAGAIGPVIVLPANDIRHPNTDTVPAIDNDRAVAMLKAATLRLAKDCDGQFDTPSGASAPYTLK